ncbi:2-phosphosulfolactate phosphatase family protein [[Limnothrix rosea] IAM M-220]|uniref:2-phosphosulfolactate phosphatase family protein n=1 Tax=[Limnothrix rosea] IAM M-220 TaxID=454133 RepID=UPI0009608BC0|nr:2-phosphosulfolactate phosphatase family protein [[Limnothrix rosea] IAM M-220]OKH14219.1 2-phosphosulfolactate phosphatase [[Limnothrix rosea] IAM M-220]
MKLFVYHTPEAAPAEQLPDCAVVIDVLRATTTIATALHAGAEAVQAFADVDLLFQASDAWPEAQRLRAGERGGQQVEGFDVGNSPLDCTPDVVEGKRLFLTTTNGTRALKRVEQAKTVLTAAQINVASVIDYLKAKQPETVWFVGSGWQGDYALEDTVCAGAIAAALWGEEPADLGNDEVLGAIALYRQWENNLVDLLKLASHGQRLLGLDKEKDIIYCAQSNSLNVLPIQQSPGVLVKYNGEA